MLVAERRDLAAGRRFFTRALEHGPRPSEVTTATRSDLPIHRSMQHSHQGLTDR